MTARRKVLHIGGFILPDENGVLCQKRGLHDVPLDIRASATLLVNLYSGRFSQSCHSFYLRGSALSESFLKDRSDLDLYVVASTPQIRRSIRLDQTSIAASARLQGVCRLDVAVLEVGEILSSPELEAERFLIKTSSVFLGGIDLRPSLREFRITDQLQFTLMAMPTIRRRFETQFSRCGTHGEKAVWLVWFAKKLLRAAFELIISRERRFTRDLWPCYECFTRYYPNQTDVARRVLDVAIGNICLAADSLQNMFDFAAWLSNEYRGVPMNNDATMTLTEEQIVVAPTGAIPDRFPTDPYDGPDGTTDKNDSNTSDH